jgi:hypothetical protein
VAHPLAHLLEHAARGTYPAFDGLIHVLPELLGPVDALIAFTGTFALAAPIDPEEVAARVPAGDFYGAIAPNFLLWLGEQLQSRAGTHDAVLVAVAGATPEPPIVLQEIDAGEVAHHPRVARAARYRHGLRCYAPEDGGAVLVLGRGVTNRWEMAFEVDDDRRNVGLGRALAVAARTLLPPSTPIWAQVAPGNAASLRAVLAAGYRPVGSEILFPRA